VAVHAGEAAPPVAFATHWVIKGPFFG